MAKALAQNSAREANEAKRRSNDDIWSELMMAGQAGNGGAYNRLLSEISIWLQRYYARRLPTSMIDDAVQESLVALHVKRHTYEHDRPFTPWLAAIARYKWIDRLRAMKRLRTESIEGHDFAIPDHGSGVRSAVAVDALLQNLKPAQAGVIRLVKLDGLSIEEAAQATGQSVSLVKINIHRGLARLSKLIDTNAEIAV